MKKINQLDIFRVISAIMIFAFHCNIHLGGVAFLNSFIQEGAIFMVAFFNLSGFLLYLKYHDQNLNVHKSLISFFKKRILTLYPLYFVTYMIIIIYKNTEPIFKTILIAPFELLLLQTTFDGSFSISGNDGTWFVSCIFICYLLFPFFKNILYESTISYKILLFCSIFLAAIAPFCVQQFEFSSIYSNPFYRFLEFFCGMIVASIYLNREKKQLPYTAFVIIESILLVLIISILHLKGFGNYTNTTFITLPFFLLIIFHLACSSNKLLLVVSSSKIVSYLSKVSYSFFLSQMFAWDISKKILEHFTFFKKRNFDIIFVSLMVCLLITVILYEIIEKRIVKKFFLKCKS